MKYARVFLKGADNPLRWLDVPLGNGSFAGFCSTVRMSGCITPTLDCPAWVPFDEIKYMTEIETGTPDPAPGSIIYSGRPN